MILKKKTFPMKNLKFSHDDKPNSWTSSKHGMTNYPYN